jgi:hypothetical protein
VKVEVKVKEVCFVARRMKAKETQSGGPRRFVARRMFYGRSVKYFTALYCVRPKSTLQPRTSLSVPDPPGHQYNTKRSNYSTGFMGP